LSDLIKANFNLTNIHPYPFNGAPKWSDWYNNYTHDCTPKTQYKDMLPVNATWSTQLKKCVCPDPRSFFKPNINICLCMHGYIFDKN